ncbi:accessory factor UbiK family protein [Yunchengibacter salinarum]|uniref:accessory factor UbiK family protein n=1 Tax=Yunchengibacter salinarum TaxID=3133399 RepID=UPI0035B61A4A
MQTNSRFFDDLANLMSGAAGAMNSARSEMEDHFRQWLHQQLQQMDLVTRDEFDVVRDMATRAREENAALKAEIEALKAAPRGSASGKAATGGKASTAKASTAKASTAKESAGKAGAGKGASGKSAPGKA